MRINWFSIAMLLAFFAFTWAFGAMMLGNALEIIGVINLSGVQVALACALFVTMFFGVRVFKPVSDVRSRLIWSLLGKACDAEGCPRKADLTYIPTGENLCGLHAAAKVNKARGGS